MQRHSLVRIGIFILFGAALLSGLVHVLERDTVDEEEIEAAFETMGVTPASVDSPELGIERLVDGSEARLADYEGQVVFLNFWATWCAPCVEEMPAMQVLQDTLEGEGLAVVAVNVGESSEQVTRFVDMLGLQYEILLDRNMRVTASYNVRVMPTTLIIDRSGQVIGTKLGYHDWEDPQTIEAFRTVLEGV